MKKAKSEGENGKVGIRNNRKDAIDFIKNLKNDGLSEDMAKDAEAFVQDVTNKFIKKIEELLEIKEKIEILITKITSRLYILSVLPTNVWRICLVYSVRPLNPKIGQKKIPDSG